MNLVPVALLIVAVLVAIGPVLDNVFDGRSLIVVILLIAAVFIQIHQDVRRASAVDETQKGNTK